ncbi:MAG TPA: DUF4388 domain-containing protein [Sandaracinaceae bacterium]
MHVLTWLAEEGRLTPAQQEGVLAHAQRTGERIEEALIETGIFEETELLKLLAARYGTRFVTTERLSKADIDRKTLERVPLRIAERLQVFPVVLDARAGGSLSFIVAAPGEDDVEKQVQVVSGVREVRALVARPAAIRAAIEKFYRRSPRAFAELTARVSRAPAPLDVYDPSPFGAADPGFEDPFTGLMGPPTPIEIVREPEPPRPVAPPAMIPADPGLLDPAPRIDAADYLETLNVFVSLLEQDRGELRGHSSQVARVCRLVADRVGLSPGDRHALLVAAYLHDVGKGGHGYHLTALNVARYEGHRLQAKKSREMPAKLFASAGIGDGVARILGSLYERFDGQGFPAGLAGKEIPYGARVLALVETYCDLVGNSRNPYRKVLSAPQALSVVRELSGTLFDPTLAEILRHVVLGENASQTSGRTRALVVDPDPEETTVLEMRLLEHGFAVSVVRDLTSARERLASDPPDVIVTEVALGAGQDGFELARAARELPESQRPAIVFLTALSDRESVSRAFELGAADYLVKPASAELVATKITQVVADSARRHASGVSGSLKEMSLPDVVQILCNGRRGGRLTIVSGGKRGEVHFADGQIHDAMFGDATGEEAFYAMLKLSDGTFSLDPSFVPPRRVIHTSAEGLLLEGMRRLDEGLV